ncbi:MAG: HNH endonuclease, partial [Saprospiraceae bacterium]|nr:HNH endonuclease [Saprospiraceae bacterium]
GGESGRCQECNGNDNDSDSTSGVSSGNNGTGTSNDLLPYYDGISDAEMVSNLDGIFQLSSSQESYLIANPAFLETFYDSYNSTTNQQNRADVMYSTLLSEATFPVNHLELAFEIGYLALENPSWPRWRVVGAAYLNVALNQTHTALDLIGLIPGLGEPADFINAGLYIIEGDGANATISLMASTPFGWVATTPRLVFKVVKKADGVTNYTLRMLKDNNGTIRFVTKNGVENSGQLKAIMQTGVGQQAHHIMPWAKRTNPIIQKAAKSGKFHINDTFNGINLNLDVHKGYSRAHWLYDTRLQNVLDEMNDLYANESASFVYNKLATLVNQTRSQLVNGKTLDQVIFITP